MSDGSYCEGVQVKTTSGSNPNGMFSSDLTGSTGDFCLEGPAGGPRRIYVGSNLVSSGIFPIMPGMCSNARCQRIGTLTVPDDTECGNYNGGCSSPCASNEVCIGGVCVGGGLLSFTLTWQNPGDLDLHVTPPCGTTIYYGNSRACGGYLDQDDTSGTGPENVFWDASYTSGAYTVCVDYFETFSTRYTLSVKKSGSTVHAESGSSNNCYTYTL